MGEFLFAGVLFFIGYLLYTGFQKGLHGDEENGRSRDIPEPPPTAIDRPKVQATTDQPGDSWEGWFYEVESPRRVKKQLIIEYVSQQGELTKRRIDLLAYEPNNPNGLLIAHCHLRHGKRTFRFDRVLKAIDAETGEILPNLQEHLNRLWEKSPLAALDKVFEQHSEVMRILLYMAKADGRMTAKERTVIAQQVCGLTGHANVSGDDIKDFMAQVEEPTPQTFGRLVKQLKAKDPELFSLTADACQKIGDTGKNLHPMEVAALAVLNAARKP